MQTPIIHIELDEQAIPRTINRRVKVSMIALKYNNGEPAEDIAAHYDITLADVYAALAYFHDNRAYFEAREQTVQPLLEQAKRNTADLNAKIEARLQQNSRE